MIHDIDFDTSPFDAGASRPIVVRGTHDYSIEVNCFTDNPPPPGYKPCKECGVIRGSTGQHIVITASKNRFEKNGGTLHVTITDDEGDSQHLSVSVLRKSSDKGSTPTPALA